MSKPVRLLKQQIWHGTSTGSRQASLPSRRFSQYRVLWQEHHPQQQPKIRYYHEVSYAAASPGGDPSEVLRYRSDPTIHDDQSPPESLLTSLSDCPTSLLCRVEMIHAPWNPADVNMVQGRYPSPYAKDDNDFIHHNASRYFCDDSSECFTVVGSEGWGQVSNVIPLDGDVPFDIVDTMDRIQKKSLVTFGVSGLGTMRSSFWVPSTALLTVPKPLMDRLGPAGCTLFQLGGTALRMLSDFVSLQSGDVVLQNAGNSGVGILASQLASSSLFPKDVSVVSVVRRGSKSPNDFDELVKYMTQVGKCSLVVAEEDLIDNKEAVRRLQGQLRDLSSHGQLPKLALNAVGGTSAQLLLKLLEPGGTMVTYGGMSGKGVQVGTSQLIFKNLHVHGYWHSRWMVQHSIAEKQGMIDKLSEAVLKENVTCPAVKVFPLQDLQHALQWQSEQSNSVIRSKLVWDCREQIES